MNFLRGAFLKLNGALAFQITTLLSIAGCGPAPTFSNSIEASATACSPGVAEFLVGDGFMKILCGCTQANEAPGTVFPSPSNLTCHLPTRKTQVFFYYSGTILQHRIVLSPNQSLIQLPSSPVSNPSDSSPIRSYSVSFSQLPLQTVEFQDSFSAMKGKFIVP